MNDGAAALVLCDPGFRPVVERVGAPAFDRSRDVIYGMGPDLRLTYANAAWMRFALENDGRSMLEEWSLGRFVPDAFGPLKDFYIEAFQRALATRTVWEHTYSCPSPRLGRWYVMRVLPLDGAGLMVCHSLLAQGVVAGGQRYDERSYASSTGLVVQCSHCRRVRALGTSEPDRWDFVPKWVKRSERPTSHVLCPICVAYHYYQYLTPDELRNALNAAMGHSAHAIGISSDRV